uniref:Uncharacterized protein n=1 Tax=Timema douglasi TaxID=61478 RepID=A0A7R8VZB1_TIMDO|nr:unnamed protein product [Timema douglasi]
MTSLVLTDSSQLTSDNQHLGSQEPKGCPGGGRLSPRTVVREGEGEGGRRTGDEETEEFRETLNRRDGTRTTVVNYVVASTLSMTVCDVFGARNFCDGSALVIQP